MHGRARERNLVILVILVGLSIMRPSMCIGLAKLVFFTYISGIIRCMRGLVRGTQ
jgi:hypothetical protein